MKTGQGKIALDITLIKALIEATRKFKKVPAIKIIIALRTDLFFKVLNETKTTGSQEEKYESLIYEVKWNEDELEELLNERVVTLGESKNLNLNLKNLLPKNQIFHKSALHYFFDRTFLRPRDAIQFLNLCLNCSHKMTRVNKTKLQEAERIYSQKRLRFIYDEWRSNFPNLKDYVTILENKHIVFNVRHIDKKEVEDFVVKSVQESRDHGPLYPLAKRYYDGKAPISRLVLRMLHCLYISGLVGVKTSPHSEINWSFKDAHLLELSQLTENLDYHIHPTFWMGLGVKVNSSKI